MYWYCLGPFELGTFELVGKRDEDTSRDRVFAMNLPGWKSRVWAIYESGYERGDCGGGTMVVRMRGEINMVPGPKIVMTMAMAMATTMATTTTMEMMIRRKTRGG